MSRQRSLQKGRYWDAGDHSTSRRHVGHLTVVAIALPFTDQAQQVSRNGTSTSTCTGRARGDPANSRSEWCSDVDWRSSPETNRRRPAGSRAPAGRDFRDRIAAEKCRRRATSDLRLAFCRVSHSKFRDAVAERPDQCHPAAEFGGANFRGTVQPVRIIRQIKIAGAAGNGAAVLHRAQEFRVAQRRHVVAADSRQVVAQLDEIRHQAT